MASEWPEVRLGDAINLKRGYDLPNQARVIGNVPIVSSSGISGFHNEAKVRAPGVATGRYGTIGQVHFIEYDFWPLNTTLYVQDFKGNLPRFVHYLLQTIDYRQFSDKAAVPGVNRNDLHDAKIALPSLEEQRAIAETLGALDDRIDNLRQTNATLQAIAAALFKSRFVDFDGMPPEDMQESDLGLIPKGWRVGSVYDISDVRYGAPFASSKFNTEGDGRPLVRIRNLHDEKPSVWTSEVHPKGYLIQPGDIIVGMDGEFRAYLWGGEPSWMNQRICAFHPKKPHGAAFVHNAITPHLARTEATEVATTVIHLGKGDIDEFRVVVPPDEVAEQFAARCQPLYDRIVTNKQQVATLAALRNVLLPRLISGKLRVGGTA